MPYLIVEFAVQKHREGATILEAAIEGAKMRFRPILMTSFAFIAGLIPLVIATGAGAIGNRTIGGSAMGGMLIGTIFGVILIPGLYFIFGKMAEGKSLIKDEMDQTMSEEFFRNNEGEGRIRARLKKMSKQLKKLMKRKYDEQE